MFFFCYLSWLWRTFDVFISTLCRLNFWCPFEWKKQFLFSLTFTFVLLAEDLEKIWFVFLISKKKLKKLYVFYIYIYANNIFFEFIHLWWLFLPFFLDFRTVPNRQKLQKRQCGGVYFWLYWIPIQQKLTPLELLFGCTYVGFFVVVVVIILSMHCILLKN